MRDLNDDQRARIVLSHLIEPADATCGRLLTRIGAIPTYRLIAEPDDASSKAIAQVDSDAREFVQRTRPRLHDNIVHETIARMERAGITPLFPDDEAYPQAQLASLEFGAPPMLYVRGDVSALSFELPYSVSIVGARAATSYGDHVAREFAADLAKDHVIVSGAAYGIDGSAHRGALAAGGKTIAVLAGGVDRPYPTGHSELIGAVAQSGAVISEVPPGSAPTKWRFLARNRLIAALGTASLVVEAGWRSGSLNEAAHAQRIGRPIGAVPGPITSATSNGCHRLIREMGAHLITSADDVRDLTGAMA